MGSMNVKRDSLYEALGLVKTALMEFARESGRDPDDVTLLAVSKTVGQRRLERALAFGLRVFGENRVQEARAKRPELKYCWPDVQLHLVGHLQTNKAKEAVALFDVIQSVDRSVLVHAITRAVERPGRSPTVFVQVNTGREEKKGGVDPDAVDDLFRECREICGLTVEGLMCIPLIGVDLAQIARRNGLAGLSMGMSADFRKAIAHGANHVRVGSAIFGAREMTLWACQDRFSKLHSALTRCWLMTAIRL